MSCVVTICLPVYNGSKYLAKSLNCICNQTYQKLEILIIDDCSTDESNNIIKTFCRKDPRMVHLKNETHLGMVKNWNKCIKHATGEWIKFQFQDDYMKPETVEKLLSAAKKSKVKLAISDRSYFTEKEQTKHLKIHRLNKKLANYFPKGGLIYPEQVIDTFNSDILNYNFLGEPIVGLMHKDLFKEYGYFDEALDQIVDFEFWMRICFNKKFVLINKDLNKFHIHSKSQSNLNRFKKGVGPTISDRVYVVNKLLKHPVYSDYLSYSLKNQANFEDLVTLFFKKLILKTGYLRFKKSFSENINYLTDLSFIQKLIAFLKDIEMFIDKLIKR